MLGLLAILHAMETEVGAAIDFTRDVYPILSDRCFACHGPDAEARKADLRLDQEGFITASSSEGERLVQPGDAASSILIARIHSEDPDSVMPPPESFLTLNPDEKATLSQWINEGASWGKHWAFERVVAPKIPQMDGVPPAPHPIDAFIEKTLSLKGLSTREEASKERLLRRVHLDLTGLPPSPDTLERFLSDPDPLAYERMVDQLLASEHYGERMAMEWLDVARFADTYGYQSDRFNHLWPWRDWVIGAFNDNLPYDTFILHQMAGDLIDQPTQQSILATAFHRNHRQTNEGGSVNEEFRVEYNADRLKTTALAFMGLTIECARCHDHKYDPISQKDYYRLFAFFNNTDESGLYSHFTDAIPSPTRFLYQNTGQEAEHRRAMEQIRGLEAEESMLRASAREPFALWLQNTTEKEDFILPLNNALVGHFDFETKEEKGYLNLAQADHYASLGDQPESIDGPTGKALRFDGENSASIAKVADFNRNQAFSMSVSMWIPEVRDRLIVMHHSKAGSDAGSRGYELLLEDGHASFALIHFWPGNAIKIRTRERLPIEQWLTLGWTYDGSSRASGMAFYLNGQPMEVEIERDSLYRDISYGGNTPLQLAARFRGRGFKGGALDNLKIYHRALSAPEMALATRQPSVADQSTEQPSDKLGWFDYWLQHHHEPYQAWLGKLQEARGHESQLVERLREIMVMGEIPGGRQTHVLIRGQYDQPGERVSAGTPDSILPFPEDWPANRLGLARWLVDRDHPLTSRVVVNRFWQMLFGRGLVVTSEDFGSQGAQPSHPELLDWLAASFMDTGWDVKRLLKLMVTSQAYRRDSAPTTEMTDRDPKNLWLARGPHLRLMAEMLRDQALSAAGILSTKLGGPSVKPYQPAGVWKEVSGATYQADKGEGLHRRSLYTYWKRTAPPPAMLTFDATTREDCVARRSTTNTPLQALVLLNDPQFVEAARMLAQRMLVAFPEDLSAQLTFGVQCVLGRPPYHEEVQWLERIYQERLDSGQDTDESLESVGTLAWNEGLDRNSLKALSAVSLAILNFDEAIVRR